MNQERQKENTFVFSEENLEKAIIILSKYPVKRSAILPLLDIAQRQNNGWLSVDAIAYVGEMLEIPYIRAYEVATFYTMFNLQEVGKYHIQICGTTPCWLRGAVDIKKCFEKKLNIPCGNTTQDKMFTLSEVECLGACINAPLVQINDDYHEDLDSEKVELIVDTIRNSSK